MMPGGAGQRFAEDGADFEAFREMKLRRSGGDLLNPLTNASWKSLG
jgi:hypothetical protein